MPGKMEQNDLTYSTTPADHSLLPARRRHRRDPISNCRSVQNRSLCRIERRRETSSKQTVPTSMSIRYAIVRKHESHLSSNVSDRGQGHACHPMNTSVPRTGCFGFLLDGARRRKDIFVSLTC